MVSQIVMVLLNNTRKISRAEDFSLNNSSHDNTKIIIIFISYSFFKLKILGDLYKYEGHSINKVNFFL